MNILVTGVAGFIGFHVTKKLLENTSYNITGVDNINDYYDPNLKRARLKEINATNYQFHRVDITDKASIDKIMNQKQFDLVIHLAAQAGVRYSLTHPEEYIQSNIVGFLNILEACRNSEVKHLSYASSSSVYGLNESLPFNVSQNVDHPKSLYAASKKSNELMAHTYSHLFDLPTTGFRFFTVYGPWGRPDMALYIFTDAIFNNKPVKLFNFGKMKRDFTYIDDIVEGVIAASLKPPSMDDDEMKTWDSKLLDPGSSSAPYRILNIGNNDPVELEYFLSCIENSISKKAIKEYLPMQPGDVESTFANIDAIANLTGFKPKTSIEEGINKFVEWYKIFHNC
jgi:UDP-glucuronate 4-epimerase